MLKYYLMVMEVIKTLNKLRNRRIYQNFATLRYYNTETQNKYF